MPPDLSLKRALLALVCFGVAFGVLFGIVAGAFHLIFGWEPPDSFGAILMGGILGPLIVAVLRRFQQGGCGWLRVGSPLLPARRSTTKYDY